MVLPGVALKDILEPLELSVEEFQEICDKFTNKRLFKTDGRGQLIKDRNGNLELENSEYC